MDLVAFGQTFQGHEGFMEFMKGFKDAFPDLQITVTNQIASDDWGYPSMNASARQSTNT